jgi:hypothetical protein
MPEITQLTSSYASRYPNALAAIVSPPAVSQDSLDTSVARTSICSEVHLDRIPPKRLFASYRPE